MFNNQYILTDKNIVSPSKTKNLKIGKYNLTVSEEIKTSTSSDKRIILIGYTFHCYNSNSEQEIVDYLSKLEGELLYNEIDNLCGHFVLFINKRKFKIFTDACSSFKVFYGKSKNNTFIGSDPKTLCQFNHFNFHDKKENKVFYQSDYFLKNNTKIGHHTRYKNMYQLVSNHYLDVSELKSERIFPRLNRIEISEEEASNKLSPIFKNILNQISKRFTIYTSVTAGYDSRLLMSTTKEISEKINYYTFKLPNISDDFIDYTLPKKICSDLKLNYSSIKISELNKEKKNELEKIYDLPKISPFQQYQKIFPENKKPNILLVGFVSEVSKNYLERVKVKNGKDLVRALHFPDNKYLESYYQDWLDKNKKRIKEYGYEILDFIHWEQDITNFAGQNTYYAHHYVNLFSIFNSREIIKIMLSVNPNLRDGKNTKFFKYLIEKMWKELLDYPFNPTAKNKIILILKYLKLYPLYKYIQVKLFSYGKIS